MGPQQARRSLAAASRAGQAGPILTWLTLFASTVVIILIFLGLVFLAVAVSGSVFEPVAATRWPSQRAQTSLPVYSGGTE